MPSSDGLLVVDYAPNDARLDGGEVFSLDPERSRSGPIEVHPRSSGPLEIGQRFR